MSADFITVVSGLPRSGTSLAMQMLHAGGVPVLTDGTRTADADNPRGYLELEAVKKLKADASWLGSAAGQAVKVISMLLYDLPPQHNYRVIFMHRDLGEILASQREMLIRRGNPADPSGDALMRRHMESHLAKIGAWLSAQPNFKVLECSHRECLQSPEVQVQRVIDFLGLPLDRKAMIEAIDPSLHRNRA